MSTADCCINEQRHVYLQTVVSVANRYNSLQVDMPLLTDTTVYN
jgi:hypothetical protein